MKTPRTSWYPHGMYKPKARLHRRRPLVCDCQRRSQRKAHTTPTQKNRGNSTQQQDTGERGTI
ncbi:hypothetical protein BHE74_00039102 [Ensete ventricosum]|nr:hypothetical protein BHE74_00039102 [Ensete ventricosum]